MGGGWVPLLLKLQEAGEALEALSAVLRFGPGHAGLLSASLGWDWGAGQLRCQVGLCTSVSPAPQAATQVHISCLFRGTSAGFEVHVS